MPPWLAANVCRCVLHLAAQYSDDDDDNDINRRPMMTASQCNVRAEEKGLRWLGTRNLFVLFVQFPLKLGEGL